MAEKVFTAQEHAQWLREQAKQKRPYWYGTYYQECTEALLTRKAKQYPEHYASGRMNRYREDIAAGQICGDCVNGAIKGAVWSELGKRAPVYGSHGCPDKSADGMFEYCRKAGMAWGSMDTMPDEAGIAVRMAGHVGVYVGNGEVVEWRGFNYGCVLTRLTARKWLNWYRLPWTDYGDSARNDEEAAVNVGTLGERLLKRGMKGEDVRLMQECLIKTGYPLQTYGADGDFGAETEVAVRAFQGDNELSVDGKYGAKTHAALMRELNEQAAQTDEDDPEKETVYTRVYVTGNTVNIRTGAGTNHSIMTVAKRGASFLWKATAENGWHAVETCAGIGWISPKYSEVKKG